MMIIVLIYSSNSANLIRLHIVQAGHISLMLMTSAFGRLMYIVGTVWMTIILTKELIMRPRAVCIVVPNDHGFNGEPDLCH